MPTVADVDNLFPVIYSSNPVARHVACPVPAGTPTVCALAGHEEADKALEFYIQSLPASGALYETSQNFRTYGTDPKFTPTPILEQELPFRVSDVHHRVVYVPPADAFPPEGRWAAFTYTTQEPTSGALSEHGQVALSSPSQYVAASTFIGGHDSWTIIGNIHQATPSWQAYGWGQLNRYIYGTDEVQYVDFDTGSDRSKWYFEAPPGKYYLPELAAAYGGTLRFTAASTYGDFSHLNSPLDLITLECASCNSGRGLRIVRLIDVWDGQEKVFQAKLDDTDHWLRDPMNAALPKTSATACEIAAVLAGLSRFRILGDFTRAGEGVAIDDVAIVSSSQQPVFPYQCQQGCVCAHYNEARRISCCGSTLTV